MTVTTDASPPLAVWKFASCDGCQLTLLDCEDELLALAAGSGSRTSGGVQRGPARAVRRVAGRGVDHHRRTTRSGSARSASSRRFLVTIGACATAGGIQALRNFADVDEFRAVVYASPEYIDTLATSTPISAHVPVDFELRGCPIDQRQLLEVITALLVGRKPDIPDTSVCTECKRRGLTCVMVARRHALPRPGHPRRLRRAVPGRRPRLLRLLRPDDRRRTCPALIPQLRALRDVRRARSTGSSPPSTRARPPVVRARPARRRDAAVTPP